MAKRKKQTPKEVPATRRSLHDIVGTILRDAGSEIRAKDVVAKAREEWKAEGREPAKRFDGMVWHALNHVGERVKGKSGTYRYKKPETRPAASKKSRKKTPREIPWEEDTNDEEESEQAEADAEEA